MALYLMQKKIHKQYISNLPVTISFIKVANTLAKLDEVELIQADGDELTHIIKLFPNLPYSLINTVWRGEMARFIAENL